MKKRERKTQSASITAEVLPEFHSYNLSFQGNKYVDKHRYAACHTTYVKPDPLTKFNGRDFTLKNLYPVGVSLASDSCRFGIDGNLGPNLIFQVLTAPNSSNMFDLSDFETAMAEVVNKLLSVVEYKDPNYNKAFLSVRVTLDCNNWKEVFYLQLEINLKPQNTPNRPSISLFRRCNGITFHVFRESSEHPNILQSIHFGNTVSGSYTGFREAINIASSHITYVLSEIYPNIKHLIWDDPEFNRLDPNESYGGF